MIDESTLRSLKFEIIVSMLSQDPKLAAQVRVYLE